MLKLGSIWGWEVSQSRALTALPSR